MRGRGRSNLRYRAHVTIEFDVEVGAPNEDEAVLRIGDVLEVLIDRCPNGVLYRSYAPRHMAGMPVVAPTGGDATAPESR